MTKARTLIMMVILGLSFLAATAARAQDSDGDGMPDAWENSHLCLNAAVPDGSQNPDSDGITSLLEYQYSPLLNPCNADTDGDGFLDGAEVTKGSNPFDRYLFPREGFGRIGSPTEIIGSQPAIVWSGSEFMVASRGPGEMFYAEENIQLHRLSPDGMVVGKNLSFSAQSEESGPSLAWSGSEYGITWNMGGFQFQRATATGTPIGTVTWGNGGDFGESSMAFNGSYAIAFASCGSCTLSFYLGAASIAIGAGVENDVVWSGTEFGLVYRSGSSLLFQRISPVPALVGTALSLGASTNFAPSIAWSVSEYAVAWQSGTGVKFARISPAGVLQGSILTITTNTAGPDLVWTGTGYYLSVGNELFDLVWTGAIRSSSLVFGEGGIDASSYDLAYIGGGNGGLVMGSTDRFYFVPVGDRQDPDGDELSAFDEAALGTNPADWDSDNDGEADNVDCLPLNSSRSCDSDDDGLPDDDEELIYLLDPRHPDTDRDGANDGAEVAFGSDPMSPLFHPALLPAGGVQTLVTEPHNPARVSLVWSGTDFQVAWSTDQAYRIAVSAAGVAGAPVVMAAGDGNLAEVGRNRYDVASAWTDAGTLKFSVRSNLTSLGTGATDAVIGYNPGNYYAVAWLTAEGTNLSIFNLGWVLRGTVSLGSGSRAAETEGMLWDNLWVTYIRDHALRYEEYASSSLTKSNVKVIGVGPDLASRFIFTRGDEIWWTSTSTNPRQTGSLPGIAAIKSVEYDDGEISGLGVVVNRAAGVTIGLTDSAGRLAVPWVDLSTDIKAGTSPRLAWNDDDVFGVAWVSAANDILFTRLVLDADGDGLDAATEAAFHTDPNDWDTDGDGIDDLTDNDCVDADGDGFYFNCAEWTTHPGPDCNDTDPYNWDLCDSCSDPDNDGHPGEGICNIMADCKENDSTVWDKCATCADRDGDYRRAGCNVDTDCNDEDKNSWSDCDTCIDLDGDGWYKLCDSYTGKQGPDCDDGNPNAWNTCATCADIDGDGWVGTCNAYAGVSGPDCNNADPAHWSNCSCTDADGDERGAGCDLGADCNDANDSVWTSCATCVDGDADGSYGQCDQAIHTSTTTIGTGTYSWVNPVSTQYQESRTQVVYLAAEIGRPGYIKSLSLYFSAIPGQVLTSFTLRLKNTDLNPDEDEFIWENTGWSTVYTANEPRGVTGWRKFTFTRPFYYDGVSNLMLDISFDNSSVVTGGSLRSTSTSSYRSINNRANGTYGSPLFWQYPTVLFTSSSYVPNLRLEIQGPMFQPDCNDSWNMVWDRCATCADGDGDDWYVGCNRYLNNGPDCDDNDAGYWDYCESCTDLDGDLRGPGCYDGPDCDDADPDNWNSCVACADADADGSFYGCDNYTILNGPDCAPADPAHWADCGFCIDADLDGHGTLCNHGADCDDTRYDSWEHCDNCIDADGDGWFTGCEAYVTRHGPDCAPADPKRWSNCSGCDDPDGDFHGPDCDLGPDCAPADPNLWSACATCADADSDGNFAHCNAYTTILGPDCSDADPNNWTACASCIDADEDGWKKLCNAYAGINGPDCDDFKANAWNTCASCVDADYDGQYGLCNAYAGISGPDCDDASQFVWASCSTCTDQDSDGYFGACDLFVIDRSLDTSTCTYNSTVPLYTNYKTRRTQMIYSAALIHGAGNITSLALNVTAIPDLTLNNFTIRLKHTSLSSFNQYVPAFEGPEGWTTVYQGNESGWALGWRTFVFATPFVFDGLSNLMVDISFRNGATGSSGRVAGCNPYTTIAMTGVDNGTYGDPLNWTGYNNPTTSSAYSPRIRFTIHAAIPGPDCGPTVATVHPGAAEACDSIDNQCPGDAGYGEIDEGCVSPDADGDGLSDGLEVVIGTNPALADTDGDGLNDGEEYNTRGTDPLGWDTDGDRLPDGYEVTNLAGHTVGLNLDPLAATDGAADFDGDGIANAHDYWNGEGSGEGLYVVDKRGWSACGYWGEGDGDGFISPADLAIARLFLKGMAVTYSLVYPPTSETQDLDPDHFISPTDIYLLALMIRGQAPALGSRPAALERVSPATGITPTVAVGSTLRVSLRVKNEALDTTPGIPVVFSLDPSCTGGAVIMGGEGEDGAGRYDLSSSRADGTLSSVTLLVTSPGTVVVNAKVKQCGADGVGRYCAEVLLAEPVTITVVP